MNETIIRIKMVSMECSSCGVQYTLTETFHRKREEDGSGWNCPRGCNQHYSESELSKALEKVRKLEQDYAYMKNNRDGWKNSYLVMEKSRASYMGHFTRLKNKYEPVKTEES